MFAKGGPSTKTAANIRINADANIKVAMPQLAHNAKPTRARRAHGLGHVLTVLLAVPFAPPIMAVAWAAPVRGVMLPSTSCT